MRQVTIESPINILPAGLIPEKLQIMTSSVKFLRLDSEGFLFTCHIQENKCNDMIKFLKKHYRQVQKGIVKVSHEGKGIILVHGVWIRDGKSELRARALRAIYRHRMFFLKPHEVIGNSLRFTLVGDSEPLAMFEKTLRDVGMPYQVRKISGFEKSADSAFERLTPQQMRILRLAYIEGYYSVPRKISTEGLANLLKMKKGNVGEHLRRAEKNIMDFLMTM